MSGESPWPRRLNIAVLLDHLNFFGRGYEGQLRDALHRRCRASGHNLLLIDRRRAGRADSSLLRRQRHLRRAAARRLRRVHRGLGAAVHLLRRGGGRTPGRQVSGARLCSVGTAIPGVPSLLLDNGAGMDAAVEHLVRDHGCRQPAFVAGTPHNPEADARFEAYRAVLERHGIPFDASRVASGQFLPALGPPRDGPDPRSRCAVRRRGGGERTAWPSGRSRRCASAACASRRTSRSRASTI